VVREEDVWERRIREGRVRKGKPAMTCSHQKEMDVQNPYVPKPQRRRDARPGVESSQAQMDYSSQVVDPTQMYEYAEGFHGYARMEEHNMFYQPQEEGEAEDEEVAVMRRWQ